MNPRRAAVDVFTDGACSGNPGPGGWGALLRFKDAEKELWGGAAETTNNRMEMTAAIKALEALKRSCKVRLHTDSVYLKDGVTKWVHAWRKNGWRTAARKAVKNEELWRALLELAEKHDIEWIWVKGHAGHVENERADALANRGLDEIRADSGLEKHA